MKVNAKEYKYAVVKFLQRPHDDIGNLICIPHSWIRIRRVNEEQSIVAYPSERPLVTQRRIEDGENPSDKWKLYMAVVKLETYTYKDAHDYILEKKHGVVADNMYASLRNGRKGSMKRPQGSESQSDTFNGKLRAVEVTNQGSFFQSNISHAAEITKNLPSKNQGFIYPYIQKIPDFSRPEVKSPKNNCEEIVRKPCYIPRDLLNSMKEHLLESQQMSHQNQVSEVAEEQSKSPQHSLDDDRPQGSGVQPMIYDELEASPVNNAAQSVSSKQDDGSDRSCSPGVSSEEEYQPVDYPTNRVRAQTNFIANLLDTIESSYWHSSERILEVHKSFDYSIKLLKRIKKTYNCKKNKSNEEKQADVEETHDVEMRKDVNVNSSSDTDEDEDEDDGKKAPERNNCLRKFVLPPEYNPKDSRWTLKYQENDPDLGLVELVPGSKVLVNSIKLAHCKRVSKDCKTFARMLLAEIFSHSALTVCSLTGAKANAFHNNGTYVRPGLNTNARVTMFAYVEDYGREKHWAAFDKQSVINSVRSRIQEIRSRHVRK